MRLAPQPQTLLSEANLRVPTSIHLDHGLFELERVFSRLILLPRPCLENNQYLDAIKQMIVKK